MFYFLRLFIPEDKEKERDSVQEGSQGRYYSHIWVNFTSIYRIVPSLWNLEYATAKQSTLDVQAQSLYRLKKKNLELDLNLSMSSSGLHIEGARITGDYPTLFDDSYETADTFDEPTPLLDAICHPYPASDHPVSSLQQADYERNQLPYNGNYCYDSGFGCCWGVHLFSYSYSADGNGTEYGSSLVGAEDSYQNAEHYDIDHSYQDNNEIQPAFDYNTCYESCSGFIEDIFNYNEQEPRPTYGNSLEEMGFCESIFGYWPCLVREMQQSYAQQ